MMTGDPKAGGMEHSRSLSPSRNQLICYDKLSSSLIASNWRTYPPEHTLIGSRRCAISETTSIDPRGVVFKISTACFASLRTFVFYWIYYLAWDYYHLIHWPSFISEVWLLFESIPISSQRPKQVNQISSRFQSHFLWAVFVRGEWGKFNECWSSITDEMDSYHCIWPYYYLF